MSRASDDRSVNRRRPWADAARLNYAVALRLVELVFPIELKTLILEDLREIDSLRPLESLENLEVLMFYGDTNILDGDLDFLRTMKKLNDVWYQNRRHYSISREELNNLLLAKSTNSDRRILR